MKEAIATSSVKAATKESYIQVPATSSSNSSNVDTRDGRSILHGNLRDYAAKMDGIKDHSIVMPRVLVAEPKFQSRQTKQAGTDSDEAKEDTVDGLKNLVDDPDGIDRPQEQKPVYNVQDSPTDSGRTANDDHGSCIEVAGTADGGLLQTPNSHDDEDDEEYDPEFMAKLEAMNQENEFLIAKQNAKAYAKEQSEKEIEAYAKMAEKRGKCVSFAHDDLKDLDHVYDTRKKLLAMKAMTPNKKIRAKIDGQINHLWSNTVVKANRPPIQNNRPHTEPRKMHQADSDFAPNDPIHGAQTGPNGDPSLKTPHQLFKNSNPSLE